VVVAGSTDRAAMKLELLSHRVIRTAYGKLDFRLPLALRATGIQQPCIYPPKSEYERTQALADAYFAGNYRQAMESMAAKRPLAGRVFNVIQAAGHHFDSKPHDAARDEAEEIHEAAVIAAANEATQDKPKRKKVEAILLLLLLACEQAYEEVAKAFQPVPPDLQAQARAFAESRQANLKPFAETFTDKISMAELASRASSKSSAEARRELHQEAIKSAKLMTSTEAQAIYGSVQIWRLVAAGFATCFWEHMDDDRVRPGHRANQQAGETKLGDKFPDGCRFPGDPKAPPEATIGCRCFLRPGRRVTPGTVQASEWRESQHPRNLLGQFSIARGDKPGTMASNFETAIAQDKYSAPERMMVRAITNNFNADVTCKTVKLVEPNTLGEFQAGGKTFSKGGHWDLAKLEVVATANPDVISHELGHAELDYAKRQSVRGLQDAVMKFQQENGMGAELWNPGKNGLLRADGSLVNPQTSRGRLFNAYWEFKHAHYAESNLPTDYAKSWSKESVFDPPPTPVMYEEAVSHYEYDLANELLAPRSIHESFAEYSAGKSLENLNKLGLLEKSEIPERYIFNKMDGPEGRAAYLNLQKAIDEVAKEERLLSK
jgi:hypothetical protein